MQTQTFSSMTDSDSAEQSLRETSSYAPATITVFLQPQEKTLELKRPKTARQLLAALDLREETALVAREGELLTPDRRIYAGDSLLVRTVVSSG